MLKKGVVKRKRYKKTYKEERFLNKLTIQHQ
jgi:hypothetical protein